MIVTGPSGTWHGKCYPLGKLMTQQYSGWRWGGNTRKIIKQIKRENVIVMYVISLTNEKSMQPTWTRKKLYWLVLKKSRWFHRNSQAQNEQKAKNPLKIKDLTVRNTGPFNQWARHSMESSNFFSIPRHFRNCFPKASGLEIVKVLSCWWQRRQGSRRRYHIRILPLLSTRPAADHVCDAAQPDCCLPLTWKAASHCTFFFQQLHITL